MTPTQNHRLRTFRNDTQRPLQADAQCAFNINSHCPCICVLDQTSCCCDFCSFFITSRNVLRFEHPLRYADRRCFHSCISFVNGSLRTKDIPRRTRLVWRWIQINAHELGAVRPLLIHPTYCVVAAWPPPRCDIINGFAGTYIIIYRTRLLIKAFINFPKQIFVCTSKF